MPSSGAPVAGSVGKPERLPARQHDLDGLAGRDGVLGDLHGMDVFLATEAGLDRVDRSGRAVVRGVERGRSPSRTRSAATVRSSASKIAVSAIR